MYPDLGRPFFFIKQDIVQLDLYIDITDLRFVKYDTVVLTVVMEAFQRSIHFHLFEFESLLLFVLLAMADLNKEVKYRVHSELNTAYRQWITVKCRFFSFLFQNIVYAG